MSIRSGGATLRRLLLSLAIPVVVATAALGALGTSAGASAPTIHTTVESDVPVHGLPAPWHLKLGITGYPSAASSVGLELLRTTKAGHLAMMAWSVAGPTMSCGAKLAGCTVATGTALGSYGRLSLTFHATGVLRTQKLHCPGGGDLIDTLRSRSGVLTGTLRLVTGNPWFGTIRNRASSAHRVAVRLPAVVTRHAETGVDCQPAAICPRWFVLQAVDGIVAVRDRDTGKGAVSVYAALPSKVSGVQVEVGARVSTHGVAALAVDDDPDPLAASTTTLPANPFATGTVVFALHGPLETPNGPCSLTRRAGTIDSTVVLRLPGMADLPIANTTGYLERVAP